MNGLHPFQQKGLGFAPYRFVRLIRESGGCSYCGRLISWSCWVADVAGREFVVGTDCVEKTCEGGALYDEATRELKRQQKVARVEAKYAKVIDLRRRREAAESVLKADRGRLADVPYVAFFDGKTYGCMRSHVEYLLRGHLSSDRGIKQVEQACKIVEASIAAASPST